LNDVGAAVTVDVVVPVYNEELILAASIERLRSYLSETFPFAWRIVIADNASTDTTGTIAATLAGADERIVHLHLDQKGRGRALRAAWSASSADIVVYTDVDLSTGLTGLLPLVAPLVSGHSDLAIGSRLSSGSVVARGPKRELISRAYNLLLRLVFAVRFRDAQCGFKAGRTDVIKLLLPAVEDEAWFFDTELLLLAEYNGLRIHEVPIDWIDDLDSRVDVRSTALADLSGVRRMAMRFLRGNGHIELGPFERRPLADQPRSLPGPAQRDRGNLGQLRRVHRHRARQQLGEPAVDVPSPQRRGPTLAVRDEFRGLSRLAARDDGGVGLGGGQFHVGVDRAVADMGDRGSAALRGAEGVGVSALGCSGRAVPGPLGVEPVGRIHPGPDSVGVGSEIVVGRRGDARVDPSRQRPVDHQ
jgi:hypothetical protein